MSAGPWLSWKRGWILSGLILAAAVAGGCADPEMEKDPSEYFQEGTVTGVSDPIAFTDEPYTIQGDIGIASLQALFPDFPPVWLGFSKGKTYPVPGDCDPERTQDVTVPEYLDELPAVIEGVVTLHPRYFQKVSVCGTEERYYGSYIIQDQTGGIHVLKDSRVADFDVGDRVRMKVTGVMRNFDNYFVLAFTDEEVVTPAEGPDPIYYEAVDRPFSAAADAYQVRRIRGRVVLEATNQNFNEMAVQSLENENVEWLVSLDRELGTRGVAPKEGAIVELTGPVIDSFGMRMLIGSLGQITVIEEP